MLYEEAARKARSLFLGKNEEYGDAWNHLGPKGVFVDIHRKVSRLRQQVWEQGENPKLDTCLDLVNYALFMACLCEEEDN